MRVLVVDDDNDTAQSIALTLKVVGHEAYVAHHPLSAMELFKSLDIDAAIVDCWLEPLPPGTGLSFIEEAKKIKDIPMALVSAASREMFETASARCAKMDRVLCLRKPFKVEALAALLESMK